MGYLILVAMETREIMILNMQPGRRLNKMSHFCCLDEEKYYCDKKRVFKNLLLAKNSRFPQNGHFSSCYGNRIGHIWIFFNSFI